MAKGILGKGVCGGGDMTAQLVMVRKMIETRRET